MVISAAISRTEAESDAWRLPEKRWPRECSFENVRCYGCRILIPGFSNTDSRRLQGNCWNPISTLLVMQVRLIVVIIPCYPGQLSILKYYDMHAPRTGVRLEFHQMAGFQTNSCLIPFNHTSWYDISFFIIFAWTLVLFSLGEREERQRLCYTQHFNASTNL